MRKINLVTMIVLALALATGLTTNTFAQGSRGLGHTQCGPNSKDPKCGYVAPANKQADEDAKTVWKMLGIEPQELDIPHTPSDAVSVYYSKIALDLMKAWEIEESDSLASIVLTRIKEADMANTLVFDGREVAVPNRSVYVVRFDIHTDRGVKAELRIICFERRGTISQVRIFDGGKAYQEVKARPRK
jgi:hypothetical protein